MIDLDHQRIADELARVRERTLALCDLPDDDLAAQLSPLMSPMVWDLAHIGNYEELWLVRSLGGTALRDAAFDDLYDAFEHPRAERPTLPTLGPQGARAYLDEVRTAALEQLQSVDLDDGSGLAECGAVYSMVLQHEHQHDETLLATRQLMAERSTLPPGSAPWIGATEPLLVAEVRIEGGAVTIGTDDLRAFDNERPAHVVELAPYWINTAPVTNGAWSEFITGGGYDDRQVWSERGWRWRQEEELEAPQFWRHIDGGFEVLRFGSWQSVREDEPVQHVCWFEADAFARWAGKRLPTEHEWECAARSAMGWCYPWGDEEPTEQHANLGQHHDGPTPVGAYPKGASAHGVHGLIGDVWEWTSSDFEPWPGFESHPYDEYSKVFFGGDYKVLRGGSWAADAIAVRATFRNWDHPIRRQIFCGLRLARDDT